MKGRKGRGNIPESAVAEALKAAHGFYSGAARALGISRQSVRDRRYAHQGRLGVGRKAGIRHCAYQLRAAQTIGRMKAHAVAGALYVTSALTKHRQDGAEATRHHRFAGTRRPDEKDVVSARGGHLEGAFDALLPFDVGSDNPPDP